MLLPDLPAIVWRVMEMVPGSSSRGTNASSRPARNRAESDGNGSGKPDRENTNKL